MSEIIWFILGVLLGGCIGIVFMCLFQFNRPNRQEDNK